MKIQNFITGINVQNKVHKQKTQNINFKSCEFGDAIKVEEINYNGTKIPYVYEKKRNVDLSENDYLKDSIARAFRDDELFDNKKDIVDFYYSKYDDNDIVSQQEKLPSVNDDYLLNKNLQINRNKDFETDIIEYPQHLYKKIVVEKDPFDYSEMLPKMFPLNKNKEAYKKIDEMSYLKKGDKLIYSFEISECLLDKYKKNHSLSEMEKILPFCKYSYYYNPQITLEGFDSFYMDKYFELKKDKKIKNTKDFEKIINFINSDYRGFSKYTIDLVTDLSQNASLDEVLELCKAKKIRVLSEWDKNEYYEELSGELNTKKQQIL